MKKFLSILLVSLMLLGLILPAVAEELSSGEDFNHQSAEIDSLNSLNSEEEQTFGDNQTSMRNGLIGEESYEDLRESNEPQSGNELHMQENDSPTEKEKNAEENSGDGPAPLESDLLSDASAETIKESDDYPNSKESDLQGNSLSDSNDQMDFTSPEGDLEGNDPQEELGDSTFDLSSVDYEMTVGKSISETLNIDKKKATIGLKVETTGSLLFSVKGGVKVTLYSLQNERMIVLSCAKYQDIEWDEKTAFPHFQSKAAVEKDML